MSTTVSLINMKGGVGKTTLAFNLCWYAAYKADLKVLAVDLDPQANLSQSFLGPLDYLSYLSNGRSTVVDIFEQFSAPHVKRGSPTVLDPTKVIHPIIEYVDGSLIDLIPSRLELSWTLKNPTEKAHLLPQFLAKVSHEYDLIIIDCAPTESILTTAAYRSSSHIFVPIRPEFLATIGLPLLARSLDEFRIMHQDQRIEMGGIIFNDKRRTGTPPEQKLSLKDVKKLANDYGWPVFANIAHHSESYPAGTRQKTPIFHTKGARHHVRSEFDGVAVEFLKRLGLA